MTALSLGGVAAGIVDTMIGPPADHPQLYDTCAGRRGGTEPLIGQPAASRRPIPFAHRSVSCSATVSSS